MVDAAVVLLDDDMRVDAGDGIGRAVDLRAADGGGIVDDLTLEVR